MNVPVMTSTRDIPAHERVLDADRPDRHQTRRPSGGAASPMDTLRGAHADLRAVNAVVAGAVGSWTLSERVLRQALPSLLYDAVDLDYMNAMVADDAHGDAIGVALWEPAGRQDLPKGARALALHGLYVLPRWQGTGIGTGLLQMVVERAEARAFDGLSVRAWRRAERFFLARGFAPLDSTEPADRYPRRLWLDLA